MKLMFTYAGWGIAVAAVAGLFFQYYFVLPVLSVEVDRLLEERHMLTARLVARDEIFEAQAREIDAVTQRMEDTEATVRIWQDYLVDAFSGTDAAELPAEIAALLPEDLKKVKKKGFDFSNFEMTEEMATYQGTMMTEMQYGDFVASLDVSPETREEVRDLIAGVMRESFHSALNEAEDSTTQYSVLSDEGVRDALESILTPEQLAEFDAYEENLPEHMMWQSTTMQLQMLAGGLTEENRELVTEILVEEFSAAFEDTDEESFEASPFGGMNATTYGHARDRLTEVLAPDQLAIYDRYVDSQIAMMESMTEMMEMMTTEE